MLAEYPPLLNLKGIFPSILCPSSSNPLYLYCLLKGQGNKIKSSSNVKNKVSFSKNIFSEGVNAQ
jgi:hypothetical protein